MREQCACGTWVALSADGIAFDSSNPSHIGKLHECTKKAVVMKNVIQGIICHDSSGMNGGSPHICIKGTSVRDDSVSALAAGTYHPRFLIDDDWIGKKVRITVEVED